MSIVSLSLAKAHMNIDHDADDELISLYIDAAEAWLSNSVGPKTFASLNPLPADLKLAALKLVAFYYEHREAVASDIAMRIAPLGVISVAGSYRTSWFGEEEEDPADG